MADQIIESIRELAKALASGDLKLAPTDLKTTMKALQAAGVKSISEDGIFSIAEDKLPAFVKAIDADSLVLEIIPDHKFIGKGLPAKGICNVLIRHGGSEHLFDKGTLKAEPKLSAAVSAIMRRRS